MRNNMRYGLGQLGLVLGLGKGSGEEWISYLAPRDFIVESYMKRTALGLDFIFNMESGECVLLFFFQLHYSEP